MTIRNDNGSVTLEAALILPFSLWLILLLTAWQYLSATEILLMNSMELLADEISLPRLKLPGTNLSYISCRGRNRNCLI